MLIADSSAFTALVGLAGAVIGGSASFAGTFFAQRSISNRAEALRQREEGRVRTLFASQAKKLASLLMFQTKPSAVVIAPSVFREAIEPLTALSNETSLVLQLREETIASLFKALSLVTSDLEMFEAIMAEPMDEADPKFWDRRTKTVCALFAESARAFDDLLAALGVEEVESPQLVLEVPD